MADRHLDVCPDCQARLGEFKRRKQQGTGAPEFTEQDLAAQRRNIHRRLKGPDQAQWSFPWMPAMATAALLLLGVLLSRPAPEADGGKELMALGGDSQFYTEIYASMGSAEPRAAAPIRGLFEEK
ncbi:MAG: hypothetical protein JJE04_21605 [Acidobacteriia bacterium]|nr:hypothetical protein [Terriglobia bacterium]